MSSQKITPHRLWVFFFALWMLFLTGVFTHFFSGLGGTPGILQLVRLNGLLDERKARVAKLEAEIDKLEAFQSRLEKSRPDQEREIRRVLGYVAKDELIFEFGAP